MVKVLRKLPKNLVQAALQVGALGRELGELPADHFEQLAELLGGRVRSHRILSRPQAAIGPVQRPEEVRAGRPVLRHPPSGVCTLRRYIVIAVSWDYSLSHLFARQGRVVLEMGWMHHCYIKLASSLSKGKRKTGQPRRARMLPFRE